MLRQEQTHVGQFRCLRNYCLIPQTKSKQNLYITDVAWLSHHDWCIKYIRIMMIIMILTEGIWKLHIISVGPVIGRPICWVPFLVWLRVPRKTGQKNLECPFIWVVAKKKKTALPILQTHGFWVDESDVSELPASTPRPLRFIAGQWQLINSSAFLRDQFLAFHIPCVSGWMVLFPSSMDLGGNGGNGSVKKVLAANKWQNYIQKVAVICPLNFVNFVINFGNY